MGSGFYLWSGLLFIKGALNLVLEIPKRLEVIGLLG